MTGPSVLAIVDDILNERRDLRDDVLGLLETKAGRDTFYRHNLVPLLYHHYRLPDESVAPFRGEIERNDYLHGKAREFVGSHRHWTGVVVKGCSTAKLYEVPVSRVIQDVDILTTKDHAIKRFDELRALGWDVLTEDGEKIEPGAATRSTIVNKLLYAHEMPHIMGEEKLLVDLNFFASYRGSKKFREIFSIDAIEAFFAAELKNCEGLTLGFPDPEVDLLYLVVHYAAEIFLFEFEGLRPGVPDMRLAKLMDVALYFKRNAVDEDAFLAVIERASAQAICGFFFNALADLFDIEQVDAIAVKLAPFSAAYHNCRMDMDGEIRRWDTSPSTRVISLNAA